METNNDNFVNNQICNSDFVQVVEMTPEEKFEMYMQVPHKDLVRMKIEEERVLKIVEAERDEYRRQVLGY